MGALPVIDIAPLVRGGPGRADVARALDRACREHGFFLILNHGVSPRLRARLDAAARRFFALPAEEKAVIVMARGGPAWRGWFPPGGELTSGVPDHKEGLYFGRELPPEHPAVQRGLPLHGANLFPVRPAELRALVLEWIDAVTRLGRLLLGGLALALGLGEDGFSDILTQEPVVLFRIFHYPPVPAEAPGWGVGEHTDYG
ncbi:MAG: isopenicillin N synthase family oxygenase, partial [Myxococcales bacterium]|nr:isopenicillin N synthase family oxygenase [Myxococcales bacterium]